MNNKEIVKACHNVLALAPSHSYNNCNTVFYSEARGIVKSIYASCFSHIKARSISHLSLCIPQYKDVRFKDNPEEMEKLLSYFSWVIKASPFKEAFLHPKQSAEVYLADGIAMDTGKCPQYVIGAMSALRSAWEWPDFLDSFYGFQKLGFSKETSFILSNVLDMNGELSCPNSNHAVFEIDSLYKDNFLNFKKGEYPEFKYKKPMNEDASDYHGIFMLFDGDSVNLFRNYIKHFLTKRGDGWDARYTYKLSPKFISTVKEFVNE
jgi:hypothetical protein